MVRFAMCSTALSSIVQEAMRTRSLSIVPAFAEPASAFMKDAYPLQKGHFFSGVSGAFGSPVASGIAMSSWHGISAADSASPPNASAVACETTCPGPSAVNSKTARSAKAPASPRILWRFPSPVPQCRPCLNVGKRHHNGGTCLDPALSRLTRIAAFLVFPILDLKGPTP